VTILASLGGDKVGAHAINERGQVVGIAQAADGQWHFFFWDPQGGMQDLGVAAEGGFDINNACQIAGSMIDPNGNQRAFLWECDKGRTLLGTLGGKSSYPMAINNRGQIVGNSERSDGSWHAFLWDPVGGMQDLGTLGGANSQGRAINDAGTVFGLSHTPTLENQPFIWDSNDGMVAIDASFSISTLNGVNDDSCVVGPMCSPGQDPHMAIWRKGVGPKELFRLPLGGQALGLPLINDADQIVFDELDHRKPWWLPQRFFRPRSRHYLWDPHRGVIGLDRHVPSRRNESFYTTDINSKGCIVGILDCQPKPPRPARARAVVLEPIPERWGQR
jgi:probable HAF family extracellular repeat protein